MLTSISACQRAIGLRGYVSISHQWSRPRLSASLPTLHTPITSLCPTLWERMSNMGKHPKTCFANMVQMILKHWPIIVHDSYEEADLVNVLRRNIKHYSFIVYWIKCVALCGCLSLFQPSAITNQRYFHIWICSDMQGNVNFYVLSQLIYNKCL